MTAYSMKQDENGSLDNDGLTPEDAAYRDEIVPALLMRSYHLPGQNICQDWIQYMVNNHPVFGICCHHQHHPVKRTVRVFSLIGSICFGLAITNMIYLAFVFTDTDYDKAYVEYSANVTATGNANFDDNITGLTVTSGNLALWTIGAALHAFYDNVIWSCAACTCCNTEKTTQERMERYRSHGVLLVMFCALLVTAVATFAVALRAALDDDVETEQIDSYGDVELWQVEGADDFEFVYAYLIELVLNYFVYYPMVGTLLFTGVLTCGRYPTLGGRPYELRQLEKSDEEHGQEVVLGASGDHVLDDQVEQPRSKTNKGKKASKKQKQLKKEQSRRSRR